jgi:Fic family protein
MKFLAGLSEEIKKNLLEQLRVLWTHTSTAIEGNTLSLGETAFVLSEGLTISGKPLKDHLDVEGSDLPCLKAGYPPIIIAKEKRYDYITALAEYQLAHGAPSLETEVVQEGPLLNKFKAFCEENWRASLELVEQAQTLQRTRDRKARNNFTI